MGGIVVLPVLAIYRITKAKEALVGRKSRFPGKYVLTSRALLGLTVVKFTQDFLQWLFLTWVPAVIRSWAGLLGHHHGFLCVAGLRHRGHRPTGSRLYFPPVDQKGWSISRARKTVQVTLQILSSTIIITGYTDSVPVAMFFMVLAISG